MLDKAFFEEYPLIEYLRFKISSSLVLKPFLQLTLHELKNLKDLLKKLNSDNNVQDFIRARSGKSLGNDFNEIVKSQLLDAIEKRKDLLNKGYLPGFTGQQSTPISILNTPQPPTKYGTSPEEILATSNKGIHCR